MSGALCAFVGALGPGFSAVAAPDTPVGIGTGTVTTSGSTTVTVTGGVPPYSYDWQNTGGDDQMIATNQTGSVTSFRRTGVAPGDLFSSSFVCTVTDSAMQTADTNVVSATIAGP